MDYLSTFIYSNDGFRLMKYMSYILLIPCILTFIYCYIIDKKNEMLKKTNKLSDKTFNELNIKVLAYLACFSIIAFSVPFIIILMRLFNQTYTGEFNVGLLFSLFLSIIFSFANVYFYLVNRNEKSFNISYKPKKNEPFYHVRLYSTLLYYSLYTIFTQGFGDITPANVTTRLISGFHFFLSFIMTTYIFAKIIAYTDFKPRE